MIQHNNPITEEAGNCIAVARASVGIYFALQHESYPPGTQILVPANLCYAGIFPAVYAGLQPAFCDVDAHTGNVTLATFTAACNENVRATIVPHMYGNPVEQMPEIAAFCAAHGILLIEDCASAMGATAAHYAVGCMGDYVIYSTGYSKTLDLGFGGFLFSKKQDLSFTRELEQSLPMLCEENERNMAFFSKLYRLMRNAGTGTRIEAMICRGLAESCRDDFLHRIDEEQKTWLFDQLHTLPDVIAQRKNAFKRYEEQLDYSLFKYRYSEGAVPWRYNLLIDDGALRKSIIDTCLASSLPVSDWYPRVTPLFGINGDFSGASLHESRIINFPLLTDASTADRICDVLNRAISSSDRRNQS